MILIEQQQQSIHIGSSSRAPAPYCCCCYPSHFRSDSMHLFRAVGYVEVAWRVKEGWWSLGGPQMRQGGHSLSSSLYDLIRNRNISKLTDFLKIRHTCGLETPVSSSYPFLRSSAPSSSFVSILLLKPQKENTQCLNDGIDCHQALFMPFCGDMVVAEGQAICRLQKFEKTYPCPSPLPTLSTVAMAFIVQMGRVVVMVVMC